MLIKPTNLFATPTDMEGLMKWCELHTGSEKAVATTAAMMAWNLACKIVNDEAARIEAGNQEIQDLRDRGFMDTSDDT